MGKKSSQKTSKHEKKQQINCLIKILRPKVYITHSSNFKTLVQQLTGNGNNINYNSPVVTSPPSSLSPPISSALHLPFDQQDHACHENYNSVGLSLDSSCFSTPLEGSPDFQMLEMGNYSLGSKEKIDFYKDLESLLMEMDSVSYSAYDACSYGMNINEQEQRSAQMEKEIAWTECSALQKAETQTLIASLLLRPSSGNHNRRSRIEEQLAADRDQEFVAQMEYSEHTEVRCRKTEMGHSW
ncbi:hypothetical protein BUALT_Bualt03G0176800 [Buddleja alternifolia]|uniref:VQ domain-containing protein n=1 Tax=Buddleja alternifolia TaxID=168488 RepID=A0AAV6XZ08_9LAMI|nr:hypothetical protein BUALT_Bualt03G0176800 [Buddleja alternifolia]